MKKCPHTSSDEPCTICKDFARFVETVDVMMTAQKAFFMSRTQNNLELAKRLESQVRKEIARITNRPQGIQQKELF